MKKLRLLLAALAATVGVLSVHAWDGSTGKVYLQNVGSGLYWGAGDHLNWGTRAMLVENPEYVTLTLNDGLYKLESQVSNGGTSYYFNGDYMDNDSPVSLTITQSGDYWTIANGSTYYGYIGGDSKAIKENTTGLTADAEGAKWIIRTHEEMLADLAKGTIANPKDATFLFLDPGFGRNNRNVSAWKVSEDCTNKNLAADNANKNNNYGCGESYRSKFTISQSATVPNGVYKVSGRAFYRQDGSDNTHLPYLEANGQKSQFPLMNTGIGSMLDAQKSFMAGNWAIDPMIVEVTSDSLEIKMVCEQTGLWCILDGFELEYYGPITLADLPLDEAYVNYYNTALNATKGYQSQDMFEADKTALNNVVSANEFDATTKKQGELESVLTAIANLNAAAADAAAAVVQYNGYNTAASIIASNETNLTSVVGNPDFEVNPVQYALVDGGWNNEGVGIQYQNNTGFDGYKTNTWFAERWVASGHIDALNTHQTRTLPTGIYELSVVATFNGSGASLYVGDAETAITDATTYKLLFKAEDKEQVTFGVKAVNPTGSWLKLDNFQLTYVGEDFPAYTLVEGKMSTAAATAQGNAETTFNGNKTVANYNALLTAINAAQVSKDAYAVAATAIADAKALQTNYNFVTPAAATTFAEAIAAIETPYNNGSLEDAAANNAGRTLGVVMVGWHAAATNTPASNYMISAWPSTYTINDWSWEGNDDGSNFKVPFFQDWVDNAQTLAAKTMVGTLSGLDNGLYQVSAWVRVRATNGTAVADATGVTMDVNGGTAVDLTEGTQVGETQFQLATYTTEGLVKDGNLTLTFTVADGTNVSWLSYRDVKYTKMRDLTPEEAAVVPANLAVEAATIYKGKTTTLAPTSTTEDASIEGYLTFVSDNTSVATVDNNGVVTGVGYGTANITVTSTLNAEATATTVITVTAPTYDQLVNLDFAEGPVHNGSIITTAGDLSKAENAGAVANMQPVTGWTITENGDYRAAGVVQYNSDYGIGGVSNKVPTTGPEGTNGYALAIEAVWGVTTQYTQNVLLPAGAYTITMPIYNLIKDKNMSKNLIGFIADNGAEYLATATNYNANAWTTETLSFVLSEDTYGKLSLGFTSGGDGNAKAPHLFVDKVQIAYEPLATEAEIAALNAAIEAAEGNTLGFDEGDYAPYKNVAGATALAAAKALDTTNPIVRSEVTSATAALNAATWTANTEELNAVYDGTFAAAENNGAPAGWTMSNNTLGGDYHARAFVGEERLSEFNETNSGFFLRFDGTNSNRGSMYFYGNTAGYTMPLKEGVTYYAKVDVAGWDSTGKPIRMNVTGPEGFSAQGQQFNTSVSADKADNTPQQFLIVFTATVAGNYVINFQTPGPDTNTHNVVISNVELKRAPTITLNEGTAWTPTDYVAANVTLTRSFNTENWATFVVPFDIDNATLKAQFGDEVQVSTISAEDKTGLTFTPMTTPAITANEPVIMKVAQTADSYTFENVAIKKAEPTTTIVEGVQLVGNYAGQIAIPGTTNEDTNAYYYISSNKLRHSTGKQTIKGFRAYFSVAADAPAGIKAFFQSGDIETGIEAVEDARTNDEAIYNLAGQRVEKAQKGIYIVNGRKVLVK